MNRLFNPFRYIAGIKSLVMGAIFIVAASLMLYGGGMIQDSYLHIGYADATLLRVLLFQVIYWLSPALLLYLSGVLLSKSRIRIVDILGTTAFAQLILLLLIAPMLLPAVQSDVAKLFALLQSGSQEFTGLMALCIYALWSLLCIILYYIWNYNAFAVSCNVRGFKAIVIFIVVQLLVTILPLLI